MLKKKIFIPLLIIIPILLLGLFFFQKRSQTEALSLKRGNILEAIYGLATVKSDHIYDVKIGILTNVKNLYVKEGSEVKKGEALIEFEGSSTFRAPFSGTITALNVQMGEVALPQVSVMRLEDLEEKFLEVSLEQDAALRVKKGQKAQVVFESISGRKFEGAVTSIYPKQGEFFAVIRVENLDRNILPGMTADVVIEVGGREQVLLVPLRAVQDGFVVRNRNDKKEKIAVEIGYVDDSWGEIVSGDLKENDLVIVKRR